jgi:hypothetical protein
MRFALKMGYNICDSNVRDCFISPHLATDIKAPQQLTRFSISCGRKEETRRRMTENLRVYRKPRYLRTNTQDSPSAADSQSTVRRSTASCFYTETLPKHSTLNSTTVFPFTPTFPAALLLTTASDVAEPVRPLKLYLIARLRPTYRSVACNLNLHNYMPVSGDCITKLCFMDPGRGRGGGSELASEP